MKIDLTRPCSNCPFRTDRRFYLGTERAQEIAEALQHDLSFHCHKTVDYSKGKTGVIRSDSQHCAGALIVLERTNRPNQMMRIAERLRIYDRAKLDMGAPVFDTLDEFIDAQSD